MERRQRTQYISKIISSQGAKASPTLLESFSETLKDAFVRGELYIGNWKLEKGVDINLTFNPTSKESVQLPLCEIDPSEAAAYATNVFLEIALQAQTRECRLYPSAYATNVGSSISIPPKPVQPTKGTADVATEWSSHDGNGVGNTDTTEKRAKAETRHLKREASTNTGGEGPKGLQANPNKKARKYAAIEYESDEE